MKDYDNLLYKYKGLYYPEEREAELSALDKAMRQERDLYRKNKRNNK